MTEATDQRKPRLYLAGPMRCIQWFNFPAFDAHRDRLHALGWDVVSPADIDRACGFDPVTLPADYDWGSVPEAAGTLDEIMLRDIEALETCDAIFMLTGWEDSSGANRELAEARKLGLREFYEDVCASPSPSVMEPHREIVDMQTGETRTVDAGGGRVFANESDALEDEYHREPIPVMTLAETAKEAVHMLHDMTPSTTTTTAGETRITDALTGGQKGDKICRMDLIPAGPLMELGVHYGVGARKYEDNQWMKGYKWHLSFAAALRHMWQFWRGEDIDAETGSKHVIAAAWHMLALAHFMEHKRSHDDRPQAETPA